MSEPTKYEVEQFQRMLANPERADRLARQIVDIMSGESDDAREVAESYLALRAGVCTMNQDEKLEAVKPHLYAIAATLEERVHGSKESADAIRAAADKLHLMQRGIEMYLHNVAVVHGKAGKCWDGAFVDRTLSAALRGEDLEKTRNSHE